jgi:hypothetical protein
LRPFPKSLLTTVTDGQVNRKLFIIFVEIDDLTIFLSVACGSVVWHWHELGVQQYIKCRVSGGSDSKGGDVGADDAT